MACCCSGRRTASSGCWRRWPGAGRGAGPVAQPASTGRPAAPAGVRHRAGLRGFERPRHVAPGSAWQTAVERDRVLASPPTLCRFENRADRASAWAIHEVLVERFIASFASPPAKLILDFDATTIRGLSALPTSLMWTAGGASAFCNGSAAIVCGMKPGPALGGSGRARPYVRPALVRPRPLAIMGVRLRVRRQSPGRARGAREYAASPELP